MTCVDCKYYNKINCSHPQRDKSLPQYPYQSYCEFYERKESKGEGVGKTN